MPKATRISLFTFSSPPMRAFHMAWSAFFLCFFGWFGIAPLMAYVREDLALSKDQVGNTIIASVLATIVARLIVGSFCDRYGPRRVYTWLLVLGALPVMGIGLAQSYWSFLLFRLAIGMVGASFVITQYHTSQMFAPNVVGTAISTAAGWGNMGGGVAQVVMPIAVSAALALGMSAAASWRIVMIIPGALMLLAAAAYYRFTQDGPEGNVTDAADRKHAPPQLGFAHVARDIRVWALFLIYGAAFGVELTIHNIAALYFADEFSLTPGTAGLIAGSFGALAIFARTLGGACGDRAGLHLGLRGRVWFLGLMVLCEGLTLILFSQLRSLPTAVLGLLIFGLFVHMAAGATDSVVPFVNPQAKGSVGGIVAAGGNVGAVAAGFLFRSESLSSSDALLWLGFAVVGTAALSVAVRFTQKDEHEARAQMNIALARSANLQPAE